jgi:hypothetical protein
MDNKNIIVSLYEEMDNQNWDNLRNYFDKDAVINWNNTNESFNVEEFILANLEYPGNWTFKIERLESKDNLVISVVRVSLKGEGVSSYGTSFFEFKENKIVLLNEYWGDNGNPPQWRMDKKIGRPINV